MEADGVHLIGRSDVPLDPIHYVGGRRRAIMNNIVSDPPPAERSVDAFSAEELGRAWLAVHEERLTALGQNAVAIAALAEERYLSPDDRSAKAADLVRAKTRIEDDLIALGQVLTRCRADNPAPKPEPHADGLGDS